MQTVPVHPRFQTAVPELPAVSRRVSVALLATPKGGGPEGQAGSGADDGAASRAMAVMAFCTTPRDSMGRSRRFAMRRSQLRLVMECGRPPRLTNMNSVPLLL